MKNKNDIKYIKKQKKIQRKKARKEKRAEKRFEKLSKTEYKASHRFIIRTFRIGGPVLALSYMVYRVYDVFWLKVYNDKVLVPDTSLKYLFITFFFGSFIFMWFFPKLNGWVRKARQSNANARNTGDVSYEYSTFLVDFIQVVLLAWPLALLCLFEYIGNQIGPEFTEMFNDIAQAYAFGAIILLTGSIIQDAILKRIKKRQKKAEHQTQMMIYNLDKELK